MKTMNLQIPDRLAVIILLALTIGVGVAFLAVKGAQDSQARSDRAVTAIYCVGQQSTDPSITATYDPAC